MVLNISHQNCQSSVGPDGYPIEMISYELDPSMNLYNCFRLPVNSCRFLDCLKMVLFLAEFFGCLNPSIRKPVTIAVMKTKGGILENFTSRRSRR